MTDTFTNASDQDIGELAKKLVSENAASKNGGHRLPGTERPKIFGSAQPVAETEKDGREERAARAKLLEAFVMRVICKRGHFSIGSDDIRRMDMAEELLLGTLAANAEPVA